MAKITKIHHYAVTALPVYNLRVENDETFYANGILVHNCTEMDGKVFRKEQMATLFPPAHYMCRSTIVGVVEGETFQFSPVDPVAPATGVSRVTGFADTTDVWSPDQVLVLFPEHSPAASTASDEL